MDIKEFDVLYDSASPLFNKKELGDMISQALEEENVPHSRKSSQCLQFQAVNIKPVTKCDTGQTNSKTKRDQHERRNVNSFLKLNCEQANKTLNGVCPCKLHLHNDSNHSCELKRSENNSNTSVLDEPLQRQCYDTRILGNARKCVSECESASQHSDDDLRTSLSPKSELHQTSSTRFCIEDDSCSTQTIENCTCKKGMSRTGSNTYRCRHSNLETPLITGDTNVVIGNDIDSCIDSSDTYQDDKQPLSNIPAKQNDNNKNNFTNKETCDAHGPDMTSLSTSTQHDRRGIVRSRPSSVDEDRKDTMTKHNVVEGESSNADNQKNNIIPVEIGCFGKQEMVAMIETLVAANQVFSEFPRKNEPEKKLLVQEQNEYLAKKKQFESISRDGVEDEKQKIRIRVLEHSVKYIEMRIAESVKFAKKIPGFLDLPLEDQANLIRESRTESGIVGGMRGINTEKGVFTSKHGAMFSMEDMKLVFDETLLIEKMHLSKKIAKLNMSCEEEAILRALTITATDRCELVRKSLVENIHNKLMSCLIYVITQKGVWSVSKRLGKLCDVLVSCRYVTEVDLKQVKKIFLEWPSFSSYKLAEEFL